MVVVGCDKDDPANSWLDRDRELLALRGNTTRVFYFDGGHEMATPEARSEALKWLVSGDEDASR